MACVSAGLLRTGHARPFCVAGRTATDCATHAMPRPKQFPFRRRFKSFSYERTFSAALCWVHWRCNPAGFAQQPWPCCMCCTQFNRLHYHRSCVLCVCRFEQESSAHAGTAAVGSKAVDIEGGAPVPGDDSAAGKDAGEQGTAQHPGLQAGASFTRSSSLIDRINSGATPGRASVLGRRSGGVTRLPPPTL